MVDKAIENAQKKVEGHNFDIRKNLLEYDDVMNQQRKAIYALRRQVLDGRYIPEPTEEEAEGRHRSRAGEGERQLDARDAALPTSSRRSPSMIEEHQSARSPSATPRIARGEEPRSTRGQAGACCAPRSGASSARCSIVEKP